MSELTRTNKSVQNKSGFGLIETIIALGLAILVITSLVSLSLFTLRSSDKGRLLLRGSKLANDQLELVRAYRDDSTRTWNDFITQMISNGCVSTSSGGQISGTASMCALNAVITPGSPSTISYSLSGSTGTTTDAITYGFTLIDPITDGNVEVTDDVVRVIVIVEWQVGQATENTYVYSDLSNWQAL